MRSALIFLAFASLGWTQSVFPPAGGTAPVAAYSTLTDGSPITWATAGAGVLNAAVTLAHGTATRALNLTGLTSGATGTLIVKQDSTGGAALTLGTGCTQKIINGGSGAVSLTATANAVDILTFTYDGTSCYWTVGKNFN
jgi:hypothetical protein